MYDMLRPKLHFCSFDTFNSVGINADAHLNITPNLNSILNRHFDVQAISIPKNSLHLQN